MKTLQRNYSGKDVDMLLTAATIAETALANKGFLQSKRGTWKDPFFKTLRDHIDETIRTYLGVDSAKELRKSTQLVLGIQKNAGTLLAEFKVQLVEDFKGDKPRRDELLKQLGFTDYLKDAQIGDQQALVNLLYQFKTNMDKNLQIEITKKGTDPGTITGIMDFAEDLKDKNISQEGFKSSKKEIIEEAVKAFNEIYESVISICKIGAKFFKDDKVKAGQFSFSKIKAALNSGSTAKSKDSSPASL